MKSQMARIVGRRVLPATATIALMTLAGCGDKAENAKTTGAGEAQKEPPAAPAPTNDRTLTIDLEKSRRPWTGDLDGMIERRLIRVLTVNSKTIYFCRQGRFARHRGRLRPAVRKGTQQETRCGEEAQEQEPEGTRDFHSTRARPAAAGARRGQGRHRSRGPDDHARESETG